MQQKFVIPLNIYIKVSENTCTWTLQHQEATQVVLPYTLAKNQH